MEHSLRMLSVSRLIAGLLSGIVLGNKDLNTAWSIGRGSMLCCSSIKSCSLVYLCYTDFIYVSLAITAIYGELDLLMWWFVLEMGKTDGLKIMSRQSVFCSVANGCCIVFDILKV